MPEEIVVPRGRAEGPVAWRPRVVQGRRRRTRDGPVDPETPIVIRALALGVALLLLLDFHIRAIETPASVPHEVMRAVRTLGSRSMDR